jgi:hypothetical protein
MKYLLLLTLSFSILSCGKNPTKCECQDELNKTMSKAVLGVQTESSDLNDKCDRLYGGVEGYINETCPQSK